MTPETTQRLLNGCSTDAQHTVSNPISAPQGLYFRGAQRRWSKSNQVPAASLYLARALQDARTIELRHWTGRRWESGLFDQVEPLEACIRERAGAGALYTTLNRPTPRLATNAMGTSALSDADIDYIVRLPFDLDPERPAGTSSTDGELAAAVAARDRLVRFLTAAGWPLPALAVSGNGAHALYRTCLPSTADWRDSSRLLYEGLRARLGDLGGVKLDIGVRNPSRIWRLYGTLNRKGVATAERPHRTATVTIPTSGWNVVTPKQVQRLVRLWTPAPRPRAPRGTVTALHRGTGDYRTLDVVAWFMAHGAYRRDLGGGKHAVVCPWGGEHTVDDGPAGRGTVVWEPVRSWPTFHCSHSHCEGRALRDVLSLWGDADNFCRAAWEARSRE